MLKAVILSQFLPYGIAKKLKILVHYRALSSSKNSGFTEMKDDCVHKKQSLTLRQYINIIKIQVVTT